MTERKETDAERAYRLLAEYMTSQDVDSSMLADYDADDYDDDDDDHYMEDYYETSEYSAGYHDGWQAHAAHMRLSYRLKNFFLPYSVRSKYYALRRRLFPNNSDIPF